MRNILSTRDQRYLTILESLFNNDSLTLTELATITKSSTRNLQNDLKTISLLIDPMTITTSLREGCFLTYPDNMNIDYLYRIILKNSLEFNLLELIFFEKHERLEDYADSLFVSLSTLKRMIKHINKTTKKAGFYINTTPLILTGDERALSSMLFNYFNEAYLVTELPFPKIQLEALNKIIDYVMRKNAGYLNFPDIVMLKVSTLISLVRLKNNHYSKTVDTIPQILDTSILNNVMIKQIIRSVFKIELTPATLQRLFYQFANGRFAHNYKHLEDLGANNPKVSIAIANIKQFLTTISKDLEIPLENKEELTLVLFNVNNMIIGESYILYNKKLIFIENFIQNTPYIADFIYQGLNKAAYLIRDFKQYELEELTYIFITHWKGFADKILTLKPRYSVGIFMDSDIEHSEFIATILTNLFKEDFSFHVMSSLSFSDALKDATAFDFFVTNISGLPQGSVPGITISLYPTPNDLKKIALAYTNLSKKNKKKLSKS